MEGQRGARAAAWRPHVLQGPQWRTVLVDELYAHLIAGLLGLADAAQHPGLEYCGWDHAEPCWTGPGSQPCSHCRMTERGSGGATEALGDCGQLWPGVKVSIGNNEGSGDRLGQRVRSGSQTRVRMGQVVARSRSEG